MTYPLQEDVFWTNGDFSIVSSDGKELLTLSPTVFEGIKEDKPRAILTDKYCETADVVRNVLALVADQEIPSGGHTLSDDVRAVLPLAAFINKWNCELGRTSLLFRLKLKVTNTKRHGMLLFCVAALFDDFVTAKECLDTVTLWNASGGKHLTCQVSTALYSDFSAAGCDFDSRFWPPFVWTQVPHRYLVPLARAWAETREKHNAELLACFNRHMTPCKVLSNAFEDIFDSDE